MKKRCRERGVNVKRERRFRLRMTSAAVRRVVLAVLLMALAWARVGSADPARLAIRRPTGVLPDTYGRIAEVLLQYRPDLARRTDPVYRDLFQSLPRDVAVNVLCSSVDDLADFESHWMAAARGGGRDVHVFSVDMPISVWARDRYIARQPQTLSARAATVVPSANRDYDRPFLNDLRIPHELWLGAGDPPPEHIRLHVEGGNVVSNRRHVFVGSNALRDNPNVASASELRRTLARTFGREVVLVDDGHGAVPWPHVDMYLTPIGDDTLLVGSPAMGLDLLATCDENRLPKGVRAERQAPDGRRFDAVARRLERLHYRIVRLPALTKGNSWMVTYNNVLIDDSGDRRTVYMPIYGIPILDEAAADVYQRLGYQVRRIDASRISRLGGAVRCMANVTLRRTPLEGGSEGVRESGSEGVRE